MTQDEWAALMAKSQARFTAMTAEEQAAELEAQKLSFVRGQMGVEPVGVPTPHADVLRLTRELDATRAALAEAQAEVARLSEINRGLCRDFNALNRDGARLEERATAAEAALATARAEGLRDAADALEGQAQELEADEADARTWGGPDPRGPDVRNINLTIAKHLRKRAAAIRALPVPADILSRAKEKKGA